MSGIELEQFALTVERIRQKALQENRLLDNPSLEELRVLVEQEPGVEKTIYGNLLLKVGLVPGRRCLPKTALTIPSARRNCSYWLNVNRR